MTHLTQFLSIPVEAAGVPRRASYAIRYVVLITIHGDLLVFIPQHETHSSASRNRTRAEHRGFSTEQSCAYLSGH